MLRFILGLFILLTMAPSSPYFLYHIQMKVSTVEIPRTYTKYPMPPPNFDRNLLSYINRECRKHSIPIMLVYKIIEVESNWKNSASPNYDKRNKLKSIDYGLLQINSKNIPQFIHMYKDKKRKEKSYDIINNQYDNIHIGLSYLKDLHNQFGNWGQSISAYNCGPSRVMSNNIPEKTKIYTKKIIMEPGWWNLKQRNMLIID